MPVRNGELITMSKQVVQPEGNYYDKYGSKNPVVQKMMKGYFDCIDALLAEWGGGASLRQVVEREMYLTF